eukprot:767660-Hanusia_phi.AAC.3
MYHLRGCDVMLDTPSFNAQTTAADMLWSGVPIITSASTRFSLVLRFEVTKFVKMGGKGDSFSWESLSPRCVCGCEQKRVHESCTDGDEEVETNQKDTSCEQTRLFETSVMVSWDMVSRSDVNKSFASHRSHVIIASNL